MFTVLSSINHFLGGRGFIILICYDSSRSQQFDKSTFLVFGLLLPKNILDTFCICILLLAKIAFIPRSLKYFLLNSGHF